MTGPARRRKSLDLDIYTSRQAAFDRTVQCRIEVAGIGDIFAVTAETLCRQVIACRVELASDQPIRAVLAQLNLMLGVPARIVPDNGNERRFAAYGGLEFPEMKAACPVAHQGENGRVGARQLRRDAITKPPTNRACRAVDDPCRRGKAGLRQNGRASWRGRV